MRKLGQLERESAVETVWPDEERDFLPWLRQVDTVRLLGECVGMELTPADDKALSQVYRPSLLCQEMNTAQAVLVEAQRGETNDRALARMMSCTAGLQVSSVIWVARSMREEHRAVLEWMNRTTDEFFHAFGVEIELWRIHESPVAPRFNLVCRPNAWTTRMKRLSATGITPTQMLQEEFWREFVLYLVDHGYDYGEVPRPRPQNWMPFSVDRSGFYVSTVLSTWDTQKNAFGGELRVELVMKYRDSLGHIEQLQAMESELVEKLSEPVFWHKRQDINMSRVYVHRSLDQISDREQWPDYREWLRDRLIRFQDVFRPLVKRLEAPFPDGEEN